MIGAELRLRIISGIAMLALALSVTFLGGIWFALFSTGIALLIYYEFTSITRLHHRDPVGWGIGWLSVSVASTLILMGYPQASLVIILVGAAGTAVPALVRGKGLWSSTALVYAGMSGLALAEVRGDDLYGLLAILFVFAVVWATDIFAYFCGRALGGRKLAPAISPGKTWSGALFGAGAGVAAGIGIALAVRPGGGILIPLLALGLSIASQVGDLFESWVKRKFGVKDSSHLIPGHGGVMDRVDGLVFAAFAAFVLAGILPVERSLAGAGGFAAGLLGQ